MLCTQGLRKKIINSSVCTKVSRIHRGISALKGELKFQELSPPTCDVDRSEVYPREKNSPVWAEVV